MEPTAVPETAPEGAFSGKFTGTRRSFIRGVAAAGASTALASTLAGPGGMFTATARAARPTRFSDFTAIAPSSADAFQVPPGYRADVIIGYGDRFADNRGNVFTYGYNNDFLAFFPLDRRGREGVLFINHEYTSPFFLHGYKPEGAGNPNFEGKSRAEIDLERSTIGNALLHVRQDRNGRWRVVSPSKYNRRIYAR